jgi:hypothetical protein
MSLVSIASPLPTSRNTIMQLQSQSKRSVNNTVMRVVRLSDGAVDYSSITESEAYISLQYFADIHADDEGVRLRERVAPELDWNTASPCEVRSRATIITDATHGLYISPRSGREVTAEENVRFQVDNAANVIEIGLCTP